MSRQPPSPTLRLPGVLIADDEEAICFSLSREFRRQGMAADGAADGRAALDLFAAHGDAIDAVILDVRMPRMDGLQTLESLRRLDPGV